MLLYTDDDAHAQTPLTARWVFCNRVICAYRCKDLREAIVMIAHAFYIADCIMLCCNFLTVS